MPVYFSHPDRTLKEHLFGLKEVVDQVLPQKTQHYWESKELEQILYFLIAYHDIAKATPYFQYRIARAIQDENPKYFDKYKEELKKWLDHRAVKILNEGEIRKLSHHTLFGATVSQHTFVNKGLQLDQLIFFEIIRRHHGDLINFNSSLFTKAFLDDEELESFSKQFSSIDFAEYAEIIKGLINFSLPEFVALKKRFGRQRRINKLIEEIANHKTVSHYLKIQFLYSLLLSADKGDVMLSEKERVLSRFDIPANIIDRFKQSISSDKEIDKIREDAYKTVLKNLENNIDKNFYSITLPTGLGKTFTAYKAALRLKEKNTNHRIIYCLPFTSIIDQNGQLLKTILEETGQSTNLATLHHYLSAPQVKMKDNDEVMMDYRESEYLTEGWENEIIITTFVQLFESLFSNRNRSLRKFHNLANSIIIMDEVQNIPPKFIGVIEEIFKEMGENLNTKFLFVTATQPMILHDKVAALEVDDEKPPGFYFKGLNRIYIEKSLLEKGELTDEQLYSEIESCIIENPDKSILVIVNTKAFSQSLFEHLNKTISHQCFYLSAALVPFHRKEVIDNVKKTEKPICLVSTQVVEAGVDIDFDIVYREFAPMDSINQAAGRCNRNGVRGKGMMKIFKYKRNYPLKIYDTVLIDITIDVLSKRDFIISESEFFEINQDYFRQVKDKIQDDNDNSIDLLECIYGLQFEKIEDKFSLIDKSWKEYDFFIPVNDEAKKIWCEYENCFTIDNPFLRKATIKKLKPELLNYVVTIPDYAIEISDEEKDKTIIKRHNSRDFYDNTIGYRTKKKLNHNNAYTF